MKSSSVCRDCRRKPVIMTGLCRQCYTKKINRRVLDRLEAEFKPLNGENEFIFSKYLESTRARFVTDADISLARRFAEYLGCNAIGPLTSWSDIFATTRLVNLKYSHEPRRGCPILQVGRHLEQQGLIAPLRAEKTLDRSGQIKLLPEPIQSWAREYFTEVSVTRPAIVGLRSVGIIKQWVDYLGTTSLVDAAEEDAKGFVTDLPGDSLANAGNLILTMRKFYAWAVRQSYVPTNPFQNLQYPREKRRCSKCGKERTFRHQGRTCGPCSKHGCNSKKTKSLEMRAASLSEYSRNIFSLYIRYSHRSQMESWHFHNAKLLLSFLHQRKTVPLLNSWSAIVKLSLEFEKYATSIGRTVKGNPLIGVGCVLQELGVLPIREEEYALGVDRKINELSKDFVIPVQRYIDHMRRTRREERTVVIIVNKIREFQDWLTNNHGVDPWSASEQMARNYLSSIAPMSQHSFRLLSRFYRWAKAERYTLLNPFEKIATTSRLMTLKVCSPEQVKKVQSFIKSPQSSPEWAMMLALNLYWGLTCKEMSFATVEFECSSLKIIFHRRKLSFGNSRHRRDQILSFPDGPTWLKNLQRRFVTDWQARFKDVRVDLPRQPLILNPKGYHNRPLSTLAVRTIYYRAILTATGVRIPPNVLRRAGADLYAQESAAALLPRFGWSKGHAYKFTWAPRQLFRP